MPACPPNRCPVQQKASPMSHLHSCISCGEDFLNSPDYRGVCQTCKTVAYRNKLIENIALLEKSVTECEGVPECAAMLKLAKGILGQARHKLAHLDAELDSAVEHPSEPFHR